MLKDIYNIVIEYYPLLLKGLLMTLALAIVGTAVGLVIGLINGIITTTPISENKLKAFLQKLLNIIIKVYVEIFRGTPMMVQSMVIYWGYAFLSGGKTLNLLFSGMVIISINTGAYLSEIVRGGINSIDTGQNEGGKSIGMNHFQIMTRIILPQTFTNIIPAIGNEFVINIKDSSVLNVIGVSELYYYAGIIKRTNFQTFQTYLLICIIYLILTLTVTALLKLLEKKLRGRENYELVKEVGNNG